MNEIPPMLQLYLQVCPAMDCNWRCMPRDGGLLEQDYETIQWFGIIEQRIKEITARKKKVTK